MEDTDRIERLLALVLLSQMKGSSLKDKALQLNLAGFTNVEIADMIQTNSATVSQLLYEARKKGKSSASAKKKPTKAK